jgi:hypothetical protein
VRAQAIWIRDVGLPRSDDDGALKLCVCSGQGLLALPASRAIPAEFRLATMGRGDRSDGGGGGGGGGGGDGGDGGDGDGHC